MSTIRKKVWKEYFEKIISGKKKLELRLADFDIKEGDILILDEWDKDKKDYTGRSIDVVATYVLKTKGQTFWPQEDVDKYGFQIIQFESKSSLQQRPKVGVGVIVVKDGKVLLGKRKGAHGEGSWAFPGGHLEFGESLEDCANREVIEETGIKIKNVRKFSYTNDIFSQENKHYITCFVVADYDSGEVEILEPNKCEKWDWFEWDNLPEPRFIPLQNLLKEGINPTK